MASCGGAHSDLSAPGAFGCGCSPPSQSSTPPSTAPTPPEIESTGCGCLALDCVAAKILNVRLPAAAHILSSLRLKLTPGVLRAILEFFAAHASAHRGQTSKIVDLALPIVNGASGGGAFVLSLGELAFVFDRLEELEIDIDVCVGANRVHGPATLPVDLMMDADHVPLGVDREHCLLCERTLPSDLLELALDPRKGDGVMRASKASLALGPKVICSDGIIRHGRRFYKRCINCPAAAAAGGGDTLNFGDKAEVRVCSDGSTRPITVATHFPGNFDASTKYFEVSTALVIHTGLLERLSAQVFFTKVMPSHVSCHILLRTWRTRRGGASRSCPCRRAP